MLAPTLPYYHTCNLVILRRNVHVYTCIHIKRNKNGPVSVSVGVTTMLTDIFSSFPQSLQASATTGNLHSINHDPLLFSRITRSVVKCTSDIIEW
jgi:hypothetical protein